MPNDVEVKFISKDEDVSLLKNLLGKEIIGMDSEWRPTMTKFETMRPALFQISDDTTVYLIDMVALSGNRELDDILTQIFTSETICVGFCFKGDMTRFRN